MPKPDEAARDAFRALNGDLRPRPPVTKFAILEAARLARDPRDLTAAASAPQPSAPFAYKGNVVHRHDGRKRLVSDDGLRFEYAGTPSAQRAGFLHSTDIDPDAPIPYRPTALAGFAGMTPERRQEISRLANAARTAKVSAKRRSQIALRAGSVGNRRFAP